MSRSVLSAAALALAMALALALAPPGSGGQSVGFPTASDAAPVVFPESWVSDTLYRALANFTVRDAGNTACRKQSDMYDRHLRNYTNWAVRSEYDNHVLYLYLK